MNNPSSLVVDFKANDWPYSQAYTDAADEIIESIDRHTTAAQFDEICKGKDFDLKEHNNFYGQNAMTRAAQVGNANLIEHFHRIAGKDILNIGSESNDERSQLVCAIKKAEIGSDIEKELSVARRLIQLGLDVNKSAYGDEARSHITPLSQYLQSGLLCPARGLETYPIIRLLVLNGGRVHQLTDRDTKKLHVAMKPIYDRFICLFNGMKDPQSSLSRLPTDIIRSVLDHSRLLPWMDM